jgi:hypothetical protein
MTEEEWFGLTDADRAFQQLGRALSDRRGRLMSCAFVRLVWDSLTDERSRRAVEVAELFADGVVSEYERIVAESKARDVEKGWSSQSGPQHLYFRAIAAKMTVIRTANASTVCRFVSGFTHERNTLQAEIAKLLRDTVGNPFRPTPFSPSWRTDTAVLLASQMYESRDFSAMPILADALQDAGCENADILEHCRGEGPHVRGCWVVDLVLGKK